MKFVEEHLTVHHLLHKPHRWFLAFLLSPIHFAEMHYKKKYHLNFKHAKKLFVFDMALLASILILIVATAGWFFYNPDVTAQIDLSIKPSSDRIISGDYITYTINYKNNSEKKLENATLLLSLPPGLVIDKIEPADIWQEKNHSFGLSEILENETGTIIIAGRYFDTPHQETHITAELVYNQDDRTNEEVKLVTLIQIHRGSTLKLELDSTDRILSDGSIPIKLTLKNNGEQTLDNISLPLNLKNGIKLTELQPNLGEINQNIWQITSLPSQKTAQIDAKLVSEIPTSINNIIFELTPEITVNDSIIKQGTLTKNLLVLHPKVIVSTNWQDNITQAVSGDNLTLNLNIINQGDTELNNLIISLPLAGDNIINKNKLQLLNSGIIKDQNFIIDQNYQANLKKLLAGESTDIKIIIPIVNPNIGNDLTLNIFPKITAQVTTANNAIFQNQTEALPIKIGTQINLSAEARYYTDEGDQLGRGPLPMEVDKETRYWILLKLENTTSKITDLILQTKLPDYITWTGKSSVSQGVDIKFDELTRTATWSNNILNPHETVGIYFEVAITPTADQIGSIPTLIQNIQISAVDNYLNQPVSDYVGAIDTSLINDEIGRRKGVTVADK